MSFYHAFEGIFQAIKKERHMRIHIMIAVLIVIFAYFYGIEKTHWAILILSIGSVIGAELFNTGLEQAVNTATEEIMPSAKFAKDAAAGAVFVFAAMSVAVGVCIFGDGEKILATLTFIFTTMRVLIPCLLVGFLLLGFVIYGGKNGKKV